MIPSDRINEKIDARELRCLVGDEGVLEKSSRGETRICTWASFKHHLVVKYRRIKSEEMKKVTVLNEIDALYELRHKNVVEIIGHVHFNEYFGIVSRYYELGNLKRILLNDNVDIAPLLQLQICSEMAEGVAFLHENLGDKKLAHGNLRPENVLVALNSLQIKVGGFEEPFLSSFKSFISTLDSKCPEEKIYIPAEFLKNGPKDIQKFDSYSLGMIMHMILTRQMPCGPNEALKCLENLKKGQRLDINRITQIKSKLKQERRYDDAFNIQFLEDHMKMCWEEDAYTRPLVKALSLTLQERLHKYNLLVLKLHAEDALPNLTTKAFSTDPSRTTTISMDQILSKPEKPPKPKPPPAHQKPKIYARSRTGPPGFFESNIPKPSSTYEKVDDVFISTNVPNSDSFNTEGTDGVSRSPVFDKTGRYVKLPCWPARQKPPVVEEKIRKREEHQRFESLPQIIPQAEQSSRKNQQSTLFVEAQPALPEAESETTSEGYYENFVPPNLHTYQHIWDPNSCDGSEEYEQPMLPSSTLSNDDETFGGKIDFLKLRIQNGMIASVYEEIEDLCQANVKSVSGQLLEDLLSLGETVEPEDYLDLKERLLRFCLCLACNDPDPSSKLSQILLCAQKGYKLALLMHHKHSLKDVIERSVLTFLEDCCSSAKLIENLGKSSMIPTAWFKFFVGTCYNFVEKYGLAEDLVSEAILNLKTHLRDNAYKHSVLAALYQAKATAHKNSGHYERAIKDYEIEIQVLVHAQDIVDSERNQKLATARVQLQELKKLFH